MKNSKVCKDINKYPFIIGVTGHRDIAVCDMPALRTFIDGQFKSIKAACEDTPIAVMTCLAEGADQMCAEIALANDIPIISILPLEKSELEKDFEGNALLKFNELYEQSAKSFVTDDMEGEDREDRDYWYRQAGIYIAERCQLLLALWNGKEDTTGCGTAAIVNYVRCGWVNNDRDFVHNPMIEWIHTRRDIDTAEDAKPFEVLVENLGIYQEDVVGYAKTYVENMNELNVCDSKIL